VQRLLLKRPVIFNVNVVYLAVVSHWIMEAGVLIFHKICIVWASSRFSKAEKAVNISDS
jgi:hypothetical protein